MLLLGDTLSGQGGLARELAPIDRPMSPHQPDSPAGFLESWRGHSALRQRTAVHRF
jgi:hypothetical protein